MAKIVLGIATSHSPLLSTPPDHWVDHAARDHVYSLFDLDGRRLQFAELEQRHGERFRPLIVTDAMRGNFARTESALTEIREALERAAPDLCVVIGDDQEELFQRDNMPCFSIYHGEEILCKMPDLSRNSPALRMAAWGHYTNEPTAFPAHPSFARHLIAHLIESRFDVAASAMQPGGVGMSHAYTFLYRRVLAASVPIVPIFVNTYYPPNQPRIGRTLEFGSALRAAIEAHPEDLKVAVIASGGLSHFLVVEELDRAVLSALTEGDLSTLAKLPESALLSGNSEIKNWAVAAAAMAPSRMRLIDYVPAYRSLAGTGCGLGFGIWEDTR
jgi:3-O-methylgallate 3,4-dioxygenase